MSISMMMFIVSFLESKTCILQLEFGIDLNLHLFNLIVMFTLYFLDQKYSFQAIFQLFLLQNRNIISGKIRSKNKFSAQAKIWYLHYFECIEFDADVHLFYFRLETNFSEKCNGKNQNSLFILKFCTYNSSNTVILIVIF